MSRHGEMKNGTLDDSNSCRVLHPPNGGIGAWLQVLGGHFLFFNSWGIVNTFGVFQAFYESSLLKSYSSSQISWIGTVQGFLLVGFTIVCGPLFDRGHYRALMIVGTLLSVLGMMMSSISTKYYQIFLAQGFCVGIGGACIFLPSVAIVATYFTTKRALATGLVTSGGSIGSVLYPIVFRRLQPKIGYPWTMRVIAFIMLGTLTISIALMKTRIDPGKQARVMLDLKAFRFAPYTIFNIGSFLSFIGLYVPIFYIIIYAQNSANVDTDMSFYLLSILNAASTLGRIFPGMLADKLGSLDIMAVCVICSAAFSYAWSSIRDVAGLTVFAIIYGFLSGAAVTMPVTIVASLVPDMKLLGTWMGMSFCFAGMGILIGTPIPGTLINATENRFSDGFIFSASVMMAGGVMFIGAKGAQSIFIDSKEPGP